MDSEKLYKILDKDFDLKHLKDDWSKMYCDNYYICDDFKKRFMGVVLDNASNIKKVYTAVFPSDSIFRKILDLDSSNALLLTHHPMVWNINKIPAFTDMNPSFFPKLEERKISLFMLHVALDKNGEYGTTSSLVKVLRIIPQKEFCEYYGVKTGIIGKINVDTIEEVAERLQQVVGHKIKLYHYGLSKIKSHRVALIAGGGNNPAIIPQLAKWGINLFITGVTRNDKNHPNSIKAHCLLKKFRINLLGATHYSTEKFTCLSLVKYFEKLRISCAFISDKPSLGDL